MDDIVGESVRRITDHETLDDFHDLEMPSAHHLSLKAQLGLLAVLGVLLMIGVFVGPALFQQTTTNTAEQANQTSPDNGFKATPQQC